MTPLMCTTNSLYHTDYGIPILASKSTDYRTSTGKNHEFHPQIPQHFDCRVKAKYDKEILNKDICIKDDVKSEYKKEYEDKRQLAEMSQTMKRAMPCNQTEYIKNVQEKLYQKSFLPLKPGVSEMKDEYRLKQNYACDDMLSSAVTSKCEIVGLEKPIQPVIPPEDRGYWKYLDIYMTDNRLKYAPYNQTQFENSRQDYVTYYSASGRYKSATLPAPMTGNKSVYDKLVFKNQFPTKFLSRAPKRVPHMGMQSEYQGHYRPQTKSDVYPYINDYGIIFEDSRPPAGPWQNLCPPGMYHTEYCHVGTGWPIRSIVDVGLEQCKHSK